MKKLISLLLALMMACALVAAFAETADLTGEWYLNEMIVGEESMPPAAFGMAMIMTLNADGTAVMSTDYGDGAEEIPGAWETTETGISATFEGDEAATEFILEDGVLKVDMGGVTGIFSQEAAQAAALPQAVAAESEEQFLGEWTLTNVGANGTLLPAAALGADAKLIIEAGKVNMISGEDASEAASALVDGALQFDDGDAVIVLQLNDNGWLSIEQQYDEDTVMVMYFEQAAAE